MTIHYIVNREFKLCEYSRRRFKVSTIIVVGCKIIQSLFIVWYIGSLNNLFCTRERSCSYISSAISIFEIYIQLTYVDISHRAQALVYFKIEAGTDLVNKIVRVLKIWWVLIILTHYVCTIIIISNVILVSVRLV